MEVRPISKPTIRIEDDGPYQISGRFQLVDDAGELYETERELSLCRCGRSHEKPFCDGTHESIGFESAPRAQEHLIEV